MFRSGDGIDRRGSLACRGTRRGARAVESGSLENCCAFRGTVGSNPTPSAYRAGSRLRRRSGFFVPGIRSISGTDRRSAPIWGICTVSGGRAAEEVGTDPGEGDGGHHDQHRSGILGDRADQPSDQPAHQCRRPHRSVPGPEHVAVANRVGGGKQAEQRDDRHVAVLQLLPGEGGSSGDDLRGGVPGGQAEHVVAVVPLTAGGRQPPRAGGYDRASTSRNPTNPDGPWAPKESCSRVPRPTWSPMRARQTCWMCCRR